MRSVWERGTSVPYRSIKDSTLEPFAARRVTRAAFRTPEAAQGRACVAVPADLRASRYTFRFLGENRERMGVSSPSSIGHNFESSKTPESKATFLFLSSRASSMQIFLAPVGSDDAHPLKKEAVSGGSPQSGGADRKVGKERKAEVDQRPVKFVQEWELGGARRWRQEAVQDLDGLSTRGSFQAWGGLQSRKGVQAERACAQSCSAVGGAAFGT